MRKSRSSAERTNERRNEGTNAGTKEFAAISGVPYACMTHTYIYIDIYYIFI